MHVGLINIGFSPISGIEEEKRLYLADCRITEEGALDGLSPEELENLKWQGTGEILTVEQEDGTVLRLQKERLLVYLEKAVKRAVRAGCQLLYIHCTGFFPELKGDGILIRPGLLLKAMAAGFSGRIAIFTPTREHFGQVRKKWQEILPDAELFAVLPGEDPYERYAPGELAPYQAVLLDCASYGLSFCERLKEGYDGTILCGLTAAFALCRELAERSRNRKQPEEGRKGKVIL